MAPVILFVVMAAPYLVRNLNQRGFLGFLPGRSSGKSAPPPSSRPAPARSGPSPLAMAALGPAALLTTPQGKAAVARGIVLAKSAASGNKKSKQRVATTKQKAARGDPKAKRELQALQAAEMVRAKAAEEDEDFDNEYEDGDEDEDESADE